MSGTTDEHFGTMDDGDDAFTAFPGAQAAQLNALMGAVDNSANVMWILYCGTLVFLMQAGFAMLCAGSIRAKNAQNILLKNVMDACIGAIMWWATGYAFAYGETADQGHSKRFIGNDLFFLSNGFEGKDSFHSWFFQWAFAATAATIVSGAVAERCAFTAYAAYVTFLTGFVYPVVVHWVWSNEGWLSAFRTDPLQNVGVIDFAGCGVVHMVGGAAAGVGAYVLGPRKGRYGPGGGPIKGHSMPLVVLGTFLLWIGWYGFNPGSTLAISGGSALVAEKTAVTTTLAAAAGGLSNLAIHFFLTDHTMSVGEMCNGVLAGLVSITASCSVVEPWAAVVIGIIGAFAYTAGAIFMDKLEIDDAVNATPVHYFAGFWGLLAPGFFARQENMRRAYENTSRAGCFYGNGGGQILGNAVLAGVVITAWVVFLMFPFFVARCVEINCNATVLKGAGLFRVSDEVEDEGLDMSKHGGAAYEIDDSKQKMDVEAAHPTAAKTA